MIIWNQDILLTILFSFRFFSIILIVGYGIFANTLTFFFIDINRTHIRNKTWQWWELYYNYWGVGNHRGSY